MTKFPKINIEELRSLAPGQRPKSIDLLTLLGDAWRKPVGAVILCLLCSGVLASAIVSIWRGDWWLEMALLTFCGGIVSLAVTASVCRGVVSSNWGTFFARTEPVRYGFFLSMHLAVYGVLIWPLLSHLWIGS